MELSEMSSFININHSLERLFAPLFCVYLLHVIYASEENVLDALRAQKILPEALALSGKSLVEYLRKNQKLFEVELNPTKKFYKDMVMDPEFVSRDQYHNTAVLDESDNGDDIPESFDSRIKWAHCPSLFYIRDQSLCGSCWAISTASAISDRLCIATNGTVKVHISGDDILSCCRSCGRGCNGGWPHTAWQFFAKEGAVTGGNYGSKDCCRPYEIPPCGWHKGEPHYDCRALYKGGTPACKRECQPGYSKNYTMDKYYGKNGYYLPNVKTIQREIMRNGPVVAVYTVYQDFYHYTKGIYKHTAGQQTGGHAVKIIGWGEEKTGNKSIPYWIIANSWHNDWGENGYFRMIRGINDCGLE
ncbi:papain family cysteine protease, partial [Teladorsagia circumcincta]